MMELNTKSPFIWDWDNLVVLPSKTVDLPKKLHLVDSELDAIDGFEIGSFHSAESSDLAFGSSSKSSKSASVSDCFSQDPSTRKEMVNSVTEISIDSGESLIGLRLGKRTYFENGGGGNNGKVSASVPRRSKGSTQSAEIQRCQVEGCNLDLSSAKDYHRKHRVCENHSKSPKVVICGVERRFCQQCSRFHGLSEFDQRKRSCRRRLSDHNARRRKPKPEIIQFSSMRIPSSLHVGSEGRSQMNLGFSQVSTGQTRPNANATWDFTSNSELPQERVGLFQPAKSEGIFAANAAHSMVQEPGFKVSFGSPQLLPSKSATSEAFHRGFQVSTTSTTAIDAARNIGALSLLSTNTWASCAQPQGPDSALHHSGVLSHDHQTEPPDPSEYWPHQPPARKTTGGPNHFQEFRLFEPPAEPGFYSYEDLR